MSLTDTCFYLQQTCTSLSFYVRRLKTALPLQIVQLKLWRQVRGDNTLHSMLSDLFISHSYDEFFGCKLTAGSLLPGWNSQWFIVGRTSISKRLQWFLLIFIAAHKCVSLCAAWSTLFSLVCFYSIIPGHLENGKWISFASTFLLVKKINNYKLHTMYWNWLWFSFFPSLFLLLTLSIKANQGRCLLQLNPLGQYFLSVNINWIKPSSSLSNWGNEGQQRKMNKTLRCSQAVFSYLCEIKHVCRTLTTFYVQNNTGQCFCGSWGVWGGHLLFPLMFCN